MHLWYSLQNVSEDADDMFDDILKKHGKVVFRRNDQKSSGAEFDDDAESLSRKLVLLIPFEKDVW